MNAVTLEKEQALKSQIDEAQGDLGKLEQDLAVVEGELQGLMTQRERYEALAEACDSLEKLGSVGAAELFWSDGDPAQDRIRLARQRIEHFHERVKVVSENRQVVVTRLAEGRGVLAILEDDWFELQEEEEERRNEWVIEREVGGAVDRPPKMPWTRGGDDDQRFRKAVGSALLAALLFGVLFPLIPLPIPQPTDVIEVPERLVELIRQERRIPPPPPAVQERQPEQKKQVEPEPKPEEKVAEQPPKEAVKPEDKPPGPASPPEEAPRQKARASGILAFSESFAKLANDQPAARLGSAARINNTGEAAIGRPERSMITTQAPGSSGGINLAALSRGVGGGEGGGPGMAGVATTRVESSIGPGGGGGGAGAGRGTGGSGLAGRTDEEIQIVFDRYKAALYRLYNRELRITPTLQGQVILKLTIEPDGSVSMCALESTDMNAPELVQQVVDRVRLFDFGAKDVAAVTIVYPIDFLPAA